MPASIFEQPSIDDFVFACERQLHRLSDVGHEFAVIVIGRSVEFDQVAMGNTVHDGKPSTQRSLLPIPVISSSAAGALLLHSLESGYV
jgi:hypothetical protein